VGVRGPSILGGLLAYPAAFIYRDVARIFIVEGRLARPELPQPGVGFLREAGS